MLSSLVPGVVPARAAAAEQPTIYQASVTVRNCVHTLRIAGVPLWADDSAQVASTPLNVWLRAGSNTLEVAARPGSADAPCELEAGLESVGPGKGAPWQQRRSEAAAFSLRHRFESRVDALGSLERMLSTGADAAAAVRFAREFMSAVDTDPRAALALSKVKLEGYAEAFDQPIATMEQHLERSYRSMTGKLGAIPDTDRLIPDPFLDGRIWRVRHSDHDRALIVIGDGSEGTSSLTVYVGLTHRGWQVVR